MASEFALYLQAVTEQAAVEAQQTGSATIEAEHLLLAIATAEQDEVQGLLGSVGLDRQGFRDALEGEFRQSLGAAGISFPEDGLPGPSPSPGKPSRLGTSAKLVIERGMIAAGTKKKLRPEHLLLGVLELNVGTVPRALDVAGVDRAEFKARVRESLSDE
ncbi:hypothetical protein J4573_48725 [Actinomadura barringtoniae]|uniref:Clp R domain-containing protein n=1 Tax=Actinomadura barringtoniae TaxID=1427535 RepID=A0A939TCY5_9ACTN|nr:Clp protease N-terminal domain-containing protein [Actinomadura barringtoniae]MBO2455047.1 hypothetical protein [Actinomadura barringtoniae]